MAMPAMARAVFSEELNKIPLQRSGPRVGATAGEPVEFEQELYNDGRVQMGLWECTPGEFPSVKDGITEQMLFVAGDATIVGEDGSVFEVRPGSLIVTPDGWRGRWEIRETVRKIYTIWQVG
jgi:uncharacterized cupin superfamily protein